MENTKTRPDRFDAFEKAKPNELIFTLLERDPCAPPTITHWCDLRRKAALEIKDEDDRRTELEQITNAELIAFDMQSRQKGDAAIQEDGQSYSGIIAESNEIGDMIGQLRASMAEADYHAHQALDAISQVIELDAEDEHQHIDEQMRLAIKSVASGMHEIAMRLSSKRAIAAAELELPFESEASDG